MIGSSLRYVVGICVASTLLGSCGPSPATNAPDTAHELVTGPHALPFGDGISPSPVAMWVSSPSTNQIFGQDRSGHITLSVIDTVANACYSPSGLKVDHR